LLTVIFAPREGTLMCLYAMKNSVKGVRRGTRII